MSVKDDLIAAMKAYADASSDLDFVESWGATGRKIEIRNETVDTGAVWLNDPNMADGMFTAIEAVLGDWQVDVQTVALQTGMTLSKTPGTLAAMMVFHEGILLERVSSPSTAKEYSVSGKTLTFGASLTGRIQARYLAVYTA